MLVVKSCRGLVVYSWLCKKICNIEKEGVVRGCSQCESDIMLAKFNGFQTPPHPTPPLPPPPPPPPFWDARKIYWLTSNPRSREYANYKAIKTTIKKNPWKLMNNFVDYFWACSSVNVFRWSLLGESWVKIRRDLKFRTTVDETTVSCFLSYKQAEQWRLSQSWLSKAPR